MQVAMKLPESRTFFDRLAERTMHQANSTSFLALLKPVAVLGWPMVLTQLFIMGTGFIDTLWPATTGRWILLVWLWAGIDVAIILFGYRHQHGSGPDHIAIAWC